MGTPFVCLLFVPSRRYLHSRSFVDETNGQRQACVIHRDLKPANVLISAFTRAKVCIHCKLSFVAAPASRNITCPLTLNTHKRKNAQARARVTLAPFKLTLP